METEIRTCQFCKKQDVVYRSGYDLFKYGVRHYAHAVCLAQRFGVAGSKGRIPQHMHKDFDLAISLLRPDGYEVALIRNAGNKEAAKAKQ